MTTIVVVTFGISVTMLIYAACSAAKAILAGENQPSDESASDFTADSAMCAGTMNGGGTGWQRRQRMKSKFFGAMGSNRHWRAVSDSEPDYYDFVWIRDVAHGVCLAYHSIESLPRGAVKHNYQVASTAGDAEGLSVEYYREVTHWCPLLVPRPPRL